MANRRNLVSWALYDFANSMAVVVFGIYFSEWLVVRHHVSDLTYNSIFIWSSLLLVLAAPLAGVIVDRVQVKLPSLRVVTAYSFLSLLLLALLALFAPATRLVINLVIVLIILSYFCYQLSYVFYNPLLKELGSEEEQPRISGLGHAASGLGQIFGLVATLPLATGAIYLFGNRGEAQVFLPTALLFLLLALPMLLLYRERSVRTAHVALDLPSELRGMAASFRELGRYPGVHRFLLAYFFYNDAILTASHNLPIYLQEVFSVSEILKAAMVLAVLASAVAGALLGGSLARRFGTKRLLTRALVGWAVLTPLLALQHSFLPFAVLLSLMGALLGACGGLSRATLAYLVPAKETGHAFSYFAMTERLASFLGPVTWGAVAVGLLWLGPVRYQWALGAMTVFIALGLWIIRGVPEERA